jgi:hypothetical protein
VTKLLATSYGSEERKEAFAKGVGLVWNLA